LRSSRPPVARLSGQLLFCTEKRFHGGHVFKARRLFVSLISRPRVIKKKEEEGASSIVMHLGTGYLVRAFPMKPYEALTKHRGTEPRCIKLDDAALACIPNPREKPKWLFGQGFVFHLDSCVFRV